MADNNSNYYGNPASSSARGNTKTNNINNSNTINNNSNNTTDQGKIFVGGLSWQTTEESLRWHFEQYGPVVSVELMKDRHTGKPRGFGFVCFSDPSTVDLVMEEDKHEVNHKIVDVKRAQARGVAPPSIHEKPSVSSSSSHLPHQQQQQELPNGSTNTSATFLTPEQLHNKVFVGGIPPHVDRDTLRQIFEQFGPVQDAVVMLDQVTNRSRGFGFVTFEHGSNGAERSIAAQPVPMFGRNVEVKLATPRTEAPGAVGTGGAAVAPNKRSFGGGMMGTGGAGGAAALPPPKHLGLRAGQSSSTATGEFAGLAVAYGRSGWKAGYGSLAFGPAGWAVPGWDEERADGSATTTIATPERAGFSFDMLERAKSAARATAAASDEPPLKRLRKE